jgi:hypothetical protein
MHTPTIPHISFNDYLRHLPNLDRLFINWSFPVANMRPHDRSTTSSVTHLTLMMQRSAYHGPGPIAVPIAYHMSRLLESLTLSRLKRIFIDIPFKVSDFRDTKANWKEAGTRFLPILGYEDLEDVTISLRVYVAHRRGTDLNVSVPDITLLHSADLDHTQFKLQQIAQAIARVKHLKHFRLRIDFDFDEYCYGYPFTRDAEGWGTHTVSPDFMLTESQCGALFRTMREGCIGLESFEVVIWGSMSIFRSEHLRLLSFKGDGTADGAKDETYHLDAEAIVQLHDLHPWSTVDLFETEDAGEHTDGDRSMVSIAPSMASSME